MMDAPIIACLQREDEYKAPKKVVKVKSDASWIKHVPTQFTIGDIPLTKKIPQGVAKKGGANTNRYTVLGEESTPLACLSDTSREKRKQPADGSRKPYQEYPKRKVEGKRAFFCHSGGHRRQ